MESDKNQNTEKSLVFEFITEYIVDGKLCGSSIFATDREAAEHHLAEKKKTEHIVGHIPDKLYLKD